MVCLLLGCFPSAWNTVDLGHDRSKAETKGTCSHPRSVSKSQMRFHRLFVVAGVLLLEGCATTTTSTSDVPQVREVSPETYTIPVASGAATRAFLFQNHEATDEAVSQAGQFCHAKGQKVVIVPGGGKDLTFRCGQKIAPGE
jgi:hypothetical protein